MFTVKTDVSKARVASLLECWSSRYSTWAIAIQVARAPKTRAKPDDCFLARHALNGGAAFLEDDEGKQHTLDRAAVEKGLNLMPKVSPRQWGAFLDGQEDAETADQFMQLALFGKIVYG